MIYLLVMLDGTQHKVKIDFAKPVVGKMYELTFEQTTVVAKYGAGGVFVETEQKSSSLWLELAILLGFLIAVYQGFSFAVTSQIGHKPSSDVIAAARQAGANVTVSDSEYAWYNGCDKTDGRLYRVYDATGKQIAIVCQGSSLVLPGMSSKAPTLRFTSGD